jgi:hypothetical protein
MRLTGVVYICLIVAICIASETYAITGATSVPVPHWVVGVTHIWTHPGLQDNFVDVGNQKVWIAPIYPACV